MAWVLMGCLLQSLPIATAPLDSAPALPSPGTDVFAYYSPDSTPTLPSSKGSPSAAFANAPPSPSGNRIAKPTSLSILSSPTAAALSVFGVETNQVNASGGFDQISQTGTNWVRRNAVVWSDVEPTQGARVWSALAGLEAELRNASSKGMQVVMIVRGSPLWARKVPGSACGPIRQDKLAAFGNFMHDLVARYDAPPFNLKYWELGNEPDIDPSLVPPDAVFGCWGDQNDPYYGGRYYAEMLKAVYPQIKSADPQAQVMVGGLLLDCDPRSVCAAIGHSDKPAKFLEGILKGGGGPYFDGVAFHAYDGYFGELGRYAVPNWKTAWNTTGPAMVAKSNFIKSLLSANGVSGKFLMNTETALICNACRNDSTFERTKGFYVAQVYAAAIAQGLRANVWYSVLGWQNSGLLGERMNALPAFNAFKFASTELRSAQPVREITEFAGVKGYEFDRGDRRIWLVWSLDGLAHSITLPRAPVTIYRVDGTSALTSASLSVTIEPLYLEQNP